MYIVKSLESLQDLLRTVLSDQKFILQIENAVQTLIDSLKSGGKVLSCGNGGSLCDAIHFAEELTGRYRKDRPPLSAWALTDSAHMSCVANDFGYEHVFSRGVLALGRKGDVLLVISTSGNSPNIIRATEAAHQQGMKVVGLLGKDGGKLREMVDVPLVVPSFVTDRIQEIHIKIIHTMIEGIERHFYPEHYED